MNEINALIKKGTKRAPSLLPPCEDTVRSPSHWTRKQVLDRHWTCQHPDLGLLSLQIVRNNLLLISHLVYGILLCQTAQTKTIFTQFRNTENFSAFIFISVLPILYPVIMKLKSSWHVQEYSRTNLTFKKLQLFILTETWTLKLFVSLICFKNLYSSFSACYKKCNLNLTSDCDITELHQPEQKDSSDCSDS